MQKWSEKLARVIPWLAREDDDTRRLCDVAAAVRREQQELAPAIKAQTDYLIRKGEINGFTRQLQVGFQRRLAEE